MKEDGKIQGSNLKQLKAVKDTIEDVICIENIS